MIATCESCGQDFSTEADPYVVRPTRQGNELYCFCHIKGFDEVGGRIKELENKLDSYIKMRDEFLEMINAKEDKLTTSEKELAYYKAIYNPLIDGAAKDTQKIKELEEKLAKSDDEVIRRGENYNKVKKKLDKAVRIIRELQEMPDVCHLDDHFEFLKSLEDNQLNNQVNSEDSE